MTSPEANRPDSLPTLQDAVLGGGSPLLDSEPLPPTEGSPDVLGGHGVPAQDLEEDWF